MRRNLAESDGVPMRPLAGLPQALAQDEDVFKTGIERGLVQWGPVCKGNNRNIRHVANLLREVFQHVTFYDLVQALVDRPRAKTAEMLIWPYLNQQCKSLQRSLERQLERGLLNRSTALVKALILYRRHSPQLQHYFHSRLVVACEGMCNHVFSFLINAGYSGWSFNIL